MASATSCSLPPGKWKYIEPLGASASTTIWLRPVPWYPWRWISLAVVVSIRRRVSRFTPRVYRYDDWSIDYDDWSSYGPAMGELHVPLAFVLADGRTVTLRPARLGDGPAILELYESLSADSRYTRFLQATPRITE